MRIVSISDTHGYHRRIESIPDGDVLIHAGDISNRGEVSILHDFALWMKELPHEHKIVIAGNHERTLQQPGKIRTEVLKLFEESGLIYLEDSGTKIDGVNFYGSPYTPFYHNWNFMLPRGKQLAKKWAAIPENTNVLITHGPPFEILDKAPRGVFAFEHTGCEDLFERILELPNLKAHVFGHIHEDYGTYEEFGVQFFNSSICTGKYEPTNNPHAFEIKLGE